MEITCTKCGGTDFVKAGTKLSLEGKWRVYQCKRCSHKQRGELLTSFHSENEAENSLRKTVKNKIEFEFIKGESFELDFVKNVLKNTNNQHRDKYLEVFNSKGLLTNKYEFWDIWEDFAENILSKDFKLYKIDRDIRNPYSEKILELLSKYHHKKDKIKDNILCDILKRKYQFEQFEERQPHVSGFTERKGVKYYYTPVINCNCVFFIPEVEKRREDPIVQRTKRPEREMAQLTMEFLRLRSFLTLTEIDEYIRKCEEKEYEEKEYDEARIQIVENHCSLYKSIFAKNNITLSEDELQFLKELITTQTPTLDFLGITKPNSSFSRPFYFIEVKSSKSGFARASPFQKEFIEKVKEKFGILIFQIELKPDKVTVKFFSPKLQTSRRNDFQNDSHQLKIDNTLYQPQT